MADDVILETEGLTKEFRGFVAVNGVNLKVKRGTIHALIGPNGAGKTTCFNLLTKFLSPTAKGFISVEYDCPASLASNGTFAIWNDSAAVANLFVDSGTDNPTYTQLAAGASVTYPALAAGDSFSIQAQGASGIASRSLPRQAACLPRCCPGSRSAWTFCAPAATTSSSARAWLEPASSARQQRSGPAS